MMNLSTVAGMNQTAQGERRSPPTDPKLLEQAKQSPGGWIYEIDWEYPENQRTPPEAIRGSWKVDGEGYITDRYEVNARYRAIEHSKRVLKHYMHAGAKHTPNQWIVEIDPRGEPLFPHIPEQLIRGWWYVSPEGVITNRFRPNSKWQGETESS